MGKSESCSSTCTCSAIHHPAGDRVTVMKIAFATGGHSEHTRRRHMVLLLTLYSMC